MPINKLEDSRVVEGTVRNGGQHVGTGFNESAAVSRDDDRDGVVIEAARGHHILAASSLTGDRVRNNAGEELGTIEEIVLDPESGRIAYAVLAFGGFLGIGDKLFAVPWSALRIDRNGHEFVLDTDPKVLKNAPGFDKDNWPDMAGPDFGTEVHKYYGQQPFWEKRVTDAGDFTGAEHFPDRQESSSRF